jgi:hypothetical protein
MKLYKRDFSTLTADEEREWEILKKQEIVHETSGIKITRSLFHDYPKAVRHYISLFPNHYLDIVDLKDEPRLRAMLRAFRELLDTAGLTERDILNFIKTNQAYFIVGGLLKAHFPFGHHDAHLFPEFALGTSFKADYLLAGRNSDGWHLVLVELEAPNGQITLESGKLGAAFRKGLAQASDWDAWLEAHYGLLTEVFEKHRNKREPLPSEFHLLDKTRIHYVVIAGRRADFGDKTYRERRKKSPTEMLLHYDNLADAAEQVIGAATY